METSMAGNRILIVDHDATARTTLADALRAAGYLVETADSGRAALASVDNSPPELTLTSLKLPDLDGLTLLRELRQRDPKAAVVVAADLASVKPAVAALRDGARDYLCKPLDPTEVLSVVGRALSERAQDANPASEPAPSPGARADIVGTSPQIQALFKTIEQIAPSRATVLITGESGTGKELVAAAIHRRGPRAKEPFIRLNCAALAESLLESELFGHERGAFTGADRRRTGRIEQADRGTLFLDEIGEISPSLQLKLLRVLQERAFERVGGNETLHVDVRIIAATNQNLPSLVATGQFREDLYYRLNVIELHLPSLRERASDIPALAEYFLARHAAPNGSKAARISDAALARLVTYHWPGNVRELENAIEHAAVMATGDRIEAEDLPPELRTETELDALPIVPGASLRELERYAILKTLEAVGGSTGKAAETLGISVRKIQYRLQEYSAERKAKLHSVDPTQAA
jgi:two-component system response regulator HydG